MSHIDYAEQPCKAQLVVRAYAHLGQGGYMIQGTDTRGRRISVFSPGTWTAAELVAQRIRDGLPPFGSDR